MMRKFIVLITFMMLFYLMSFLMVVSAPFGIFHVGTDLDKIHMVHKVYYPFFQMMHHSDKVRDTAIKFCSIAGDLDNFSMLYWMNEVQYMDAD